MYYKTEKKRYKYSIELETTSNELYRDMLLERVYYYLLTIEKRKTTYKSQKFTPLFHSFLNPKWRGREASLSGGELSWCLYYVYY